MYTIYNWKNLDSVVLKILHISLTVFNVGVNQIGYIL